MQDIHTHLYWESFDEDREEVLQRAQEAGVTQMLVVGTNIEENQKALALSEKYTEIFASVGVHPNEFRNAVPESWAEDLAVQTNGKKVVAIGECGLDYSQAHGQITEAQKENQKYGFIQQLALAEEKELPVIIHCRTTMATADEAYWDILEILKVWSPRLPNLILHCYMGSVAVTEEFLLLPNIHFSFTGNITYPIKTSVVGGNFDLTEVLKTVPLERMFLETDCPFLAPQEYRGKRNEPAFMHVTVEKGAALLGIPFVVLEEQMEKNFNRVFSPASGKGDI